MGLFDKKYCDVCGEKIGMLGNRKLEDGNLCKNCAKKLSPWFDERRHSTVAQIKDQLEYRKENEQEVANFHASRTFGRSTVLYLDEDQRKFMVAKTKNLSEENPDVLDCSQVTNCDLDIQESRTEEKRTIKKADGHTEQVSYNPPRYHYDYNFYMDIRVNNPYFDRMRFQLNRNSVRISDNMGMNNNMMGGRNNMMGGRNNMGNSVANNVISGLAQALTQANAQNMGDPRMQNPDYAEYCRMGQEIRDCLMSVRQEIRDDIAAANAPKMAVTCPWCGATTTPDANGCCEYCGGAINA